MRTKLSNEMKSKNKLKKEEIYCAKFNLQMHEKQHDYITKKKVTRTAMI